MPRKYLLAFPYFQYGYAILNFTAVVLTLVLKQRTINKKKFVRNSTTDLYDATYDKATPNAKKNAWSSQTFSCIEILERHMQSTQFQKVKRLHRVF